MKNLIALLAVLMVGCGRAALPSPAVVSRDECKVHVVMAAIEGDEQMARDVVNGTLDLAEVLSLSKLSTEQIAEVTAEFHACDSVAVSPPVKPGDKVM